MIVERRDEIRRAELELERLVGEYRGAASDRASTEVVDVVHGEQAVAQRFAQLQRGAAHEVLALVKSSVALVSAEDNVDEQVAVSRGVTYQVVVERSAMEKPGFLDMVAESVQAGERVRVTDALPLRLLIADRSVALLPLAPTSEDSGSGALVIHPSGLLDALLLLFDMVWTSARELLPATGLAAQPTDGIDELDARLLTLLLAGLTDQAIAGQLGISARTVQRRVSALMAQAPGGDSLRAGARGRPSGGGSASERAGTDGLRTWLDLAVRTRGPEARQRGGCCHRPDFLGAPTCLSRCRAAVRSLPPQSS